MANPVEIYIGDADGSGWSKSVGWTSMSLERSKDTLTGSLTVDYFFGYVPQQPVEVDAAYGREILVYIDGWLSFVGIIDGRQGQGSNSDMGGNEGRSVSIGPNEYSVTITARGKTKPLIDSSHDIRANMNGSTTQEVIERLIQPWGIEIDWQAEAQPLEKWRFRAGARVVDELVRVGRENAHYMFEARDGTLVVTDGADRGSGDNLVLGRNILTFSATQSETQQKSEIRVRGQVSANGSWGEDAVLPPVQQVVGNDLLANELRQIFVQHYGNATEASLGRRAMYEANTRSQNSKNVTVDVFSVSTESGVPWDIGLLHRVVIPPEGLDTILECTALRFTCNEREIKTTLTLAPMPAGIRGIDFGPLANLPEEDLNRVRQGAQITYVGQYPAPWSVGNWVVENVPIIGDLVEALGQITERIFGGLRNLEAEQGKPPERIN